ncbi:MAG TPA: PPK2 family polyphosphate kinase [Actinopolymorphaceae bacterium]|jgi:PPK2 family polyphosphate:nucleotide phosphotransferase
MGASFTSALRLPAGNVKPTSMPTDATPAFKGGKRAAMKLIAATAPKLANLQERLFAAGRSGDNRRILLVLQGMDTSGKDGTVSHVTSLVSPQGLAITSFRAPTLEERAHDFLWRVRRALPGPGIIGVFDRSHYEDVLVVRVHELAPRSTWYSRYESINNLEADLTEDGVTIIKCFLHVSPEVQRERLLARLDDPTKYWKYNPADVDERGFWGEYAAAYDDALTKCSTDAAPWFVIPSDHKWYRNLAVTQLLLEHLEALDLGWPKPDFDPESEQFRLRAPHPHPDPVDRTGRHKSAGKKSGKALKPQPVDKFASPGRAEASVPPGTNSRPSAALAAKKRRSSTPI